MNIPSPYRRAAAAGAVAVLGLLSLGIASSAQAAVLANGVVFDASVTPLPGNIPSRATKPHRPQNSATLCISLGPTSCFSRPQ